MKPFHYHEDPLYAAAAAILASQTVSEEAIELAEASGEFPKIEKRKNDGYTEAFMVLNDWFFSKGKKGTLNKATEAEEKELLSLYKSTGLKTDSAINLSRINEHALEEAVEDIAAAVANFKKGDKTNFGVVTDVSSTSISFKAKDLPITKIAFNQRKMGSKDFVLDKLVKLKEGVELEEADVSWDNIDSMLPKNVIDILVGFKVYAKASEYTKTSIEKYISRMKKVKGAGGEAALLKKAFDKISKDKVASKLVDKIKQLPYDSGKDNSEWFERKDLVMQYRMRVSSILSNFESVALNRVYAKSVREGAELEGVELEEAMGMGTATITAPGNKLHGKQVSIFHKFDDGRLNVQYAKSDKKGDVLNLTLKKDQYKLD